MPKITAIKMQEKRKNRCNLFVDEEFFSGISLETVVKNRLKVGDEIDRNYLLELINESDRTEALAKAADYISSRLKTKREVKDYLLRKGYSEEIAWYCVDKLKEYDYVNDEEYSKHYIESLSKNQGKRLIEYKLMMKGVRKEDIFSAYERANVDGKETAKIIAKKYLKNKEINKENLAKLYRYLMGKGFSHEEAGAAVDFLKGSD